MADNYLCDSCNKEFPTNAAVDGYVKGYSRGFLCPHCDANLEEADQSDDVWNLKYGYLYMFIMTALLWFGGDGLITVIVSNNDFINEILGMLAVIAVYTLLFLFVNIKELAKKRTESTDNICWAEIDPVRVSIGMCYLQFVGYYGDWLNQFLVMKSSFYGGECDWDCSARYNFIFNIRTSNIDYSLGCVLLRLRYSQVVCF